MAMLATHVMAAETEWRGATSIGPNSNWIDPENAYDNDNNYARGQSGNVQDYGGFGFDIPAGAGIDGIEVRLRWARHNPQGATVGVELSSDAGASATLSGYTDTATSDDIRDLTFGNTTAKWGRSNWTSSDLADANLRIRLEAKVDGGAHVRAYWLQARVHYTITPPTVSNADGATPFGITTATLRGQTSGGIPHPEITIFWGPTDGGTDPAAWSNAVAIGPRDGVFSADVEGLWGNQINYYRCFASNAAGSAWASESAVFVTLSPSIAFETTAFEVLESGPNPVLDVRLHSPSAVPVSVGYRTLDGTAMAGSDYHATEGSLTWEPGETGIKSFSVDIIDEDEDEPEEFFHVELFEPENATIAGLDTATIVIVDDDGRPTIRFAAAESAAFESVINASIHVTMSHAIAQDVTVVYAVSGGTAASGKDYVLPSGTLTIETGQTQGWITFAVIDNAIDEPDRTIVVTLYSPQHAQLGLTTSHTYTILDDDASPPTVDNGHGAMRITSQSATLRGSVLDTGGEDPAVFVCWGTAPGGETTGSWSWCEAVGMRGVGNFEWDVDQLIEGQTYYYRVIATNSGGVGWAERIEHFTANDPPSADLTSNPGVETAASPSDNANALHWARSSPSHMRRQTANIRTGDYSMEFDAVAGICLSGAQDNVLLLSWSGLIADTDRSHPMGGIRPGFVVSGKGYSRTHQLGPPQPRPPTPDQMEYRWMEVDSETAWMSAALTHQSYTYEQHVLSNPLPLLTVSAGHRFRPEMVRMTAAGTDPGKFYVDDLTLTASLPKLHLETDPGEVVHFPATTFGNSRDIELRARNIGGDGTVLYGAFIVNVSDLSNPAWDRTAWRMIDDASNTFHIVTGAQLTSTNNGAYQTCTIRFTPPGTGTYTGMVRVATTDPNVYYGNHGMAFNSIVYYDYTLVAEAVHPTLKISSTAGGSVTDPGEGLFQREHGTMLGVIATPDPGYRFVNWSGTAVTAGWVTDPNSATTTVTVQGDHTLRANFALREVTLTFNSAGGTAVSPITQPYGTAVTPPADPTRTGYTFVGWTPAVPATMPAADLTLTAQWTASVTDPVSAQAVPNNLHAASRMDLGWSLNTQNHAVMIVRSTDGQFWTPVQGATYDVGYSSGNSTVIYKGTGTSFTDVQLHPRKTYSYRFYAYHDGTYSPGITRSHATMAPQARNSGGGTPQQPAMVYLGDQDLIFGLESWETIEDQPGDARLFIHRTPDLDSGVTGPPTGASAVEHREPRSPAFTETGMWYWGIQLAFGSYGDAFWYCHNTSSECETDVQPNASLTVDVLPLPPATNGRSGAGAGPGEVTLSWDNGGWNRDVLVVRRQQDEPEEPLQGTEYNLGDDCGGGVVVYIGSGQSILDQGLIGMTVYHYAIFSRNNGFYSTPLRVRVESGEATPLPTVFRFR